MKLKLILVQWQIQNQSKSKWWFVIRFGLKICFCSPSWFGNFGGAIFTLWLNLVKLHEKKSGSILKILPWSLKFLSVYKLVVVFFIWNLITNMMFCNQKSHYFLFKSPLNCTAGFKYLFCYDHTSRLSVTS